MSLKTIKGKIRGINKTHKVTKAMEAVSAVKMRKSQERALAGRPYAAAALSILARVSGSLDTIKHPLIEQRERSSMCLIVITSDKGLAGSLNSSVLKKAELAIKDSALPKEKIGIIAVGRKGHEHFEKRGYTIINYVENIADDVSEADLKTLTQTAVEVFGNTYNQVVMLHSQFRSTFEQDAVARQILPLNPAEVREIIRGIAPETGTYADRTVVDRHASYTVEPDHETVLAALLPHLLRILLYHSLLEGKASEHSARMVAMKNASEKASELSRDLTRSLNSARQAHITREVGEIVGGIEAMST